MFFCCFVAFVDFWNDKQETRESEILVFGDNEKLPEMAMPYTLESRGNQRFYDRFPNVFLHKDELLHPEIVKCVETIFQSFVVEEFENKKRYVVVSTLGSMASVYSRFINGYTPFDRNLDIIKHVSALKMKEFLSVCCVCVCVCIKAKINNQTTKIQTTTHNKQFG